MNARVQLSLMFVFFVFLPQGQAADDHLFNKSTLRYDYVKVVRLIKSDVIVLENGRKLRLIGVKASDAPRRMNRPTDQYGFVIQEDVVPTTSVEERGFSFAEELLLQKKVRVESDIKFTDAEGYPVGYVFLKDGTFVNAELLRQGYAELHIQPPNLKYAEQLREAYREARFQKRGTHAE